MRVSISNIGFKIKPQSKEISKLIFQEKEITIEELKDYISQGFCYCNVFNNNEFTIKDKTKSNFKYSNIISIDIDHTDVSFIEAIQNIKTTPTIAYETYSNGKNNQYSYRLIYEIKEDVYSDKIRSVIDYFSNKVEKELDVKIDTKASNPYQYFNGTTGTNRIVTNDVIYSLNDIDLSNLPIRQNNNIQKTKREEKEYNIDTNDPIQKDFFNLSIKDFVYKYQGCFINKECTDLPDTSEDEPVIYFPSDYREIRRYWFLDCIDDEHKYSSTRKIGDGQGRKSKLFFNAIIRRLIEPTLSFNNLLYNICYEVYFYIDNTDGEITKRHIYKHICEDAMNADLNEYQDFGKSNRKYIANPAYCIKYNKTKRQAVNMVNSNKTHKFTHRTTKIDYSKVEELYNPSLTVQQNVDLLKEHNINIGKRTFMYWKKTMNIQKENKEIKMENEELKEKINNITVNEENNNFNFTDTFNEFKNEINDKFNLIMNAINQLNQNIMTINMTTMPANRTKTPHTGDNTASVDNYTTETLSCAEKAVSEGNNNNEELNALKKEMEALKEQNNDLLYQVTQLRKENAQLKEELDDAKKQINNLNDIIKAYQKSEIELKNTNQDLNERLVKARNYCKDINWLRSRLTKLELKDKPLDVIPSARMTQENKNGQQQVKDDKLSQVQIEFFKAFEQKCITGVKTLSNDNEYKAFKELMQNTLLRHVDEGRFSKIHNETLSILVKDLYSNVENAYYHISTDITPVNRTETPHTGDNTISVDNHTTIVPTVDYKDVSEGNNTVVVTDATKEEDFKEPFCYVEGTDENSNTTNETKTTVDNIVLPTVKEEKTEEEALEEALDLIYAQ